MGLIAYNLTGSPVALAAGTPIVTLPASSNPPNKGPAVNVTSELRPNATVDPTNGITGGVAAAGFTAIQAQVAAGTIALEWTGEAEYLTGALISGGPSPSFQGSAAVAVFTQSGQPTATDTLTVGSDVYEADGAGSNINFVIAGTAEGTLDNLLAAAIASGTEPLKWAKLSATQLVARKANEPDGSVEAGDPDIAITCGLTNWVSDVGDVNMNTLAGKAAGVYAVAHTSLTVTTAMITATSVRIAFPFTPTGFQVTCLASGLSFHPATDVFNIVGNDIVITLNGGAGELQNGNVVHITAWE